MIWQKSGITFLPGPRPFYAAGINNRDEVVGNGYTPQGEFHAFLISRSQATDLGTPQNRPGSSVTATAVNDQGQVVGYTLFRNLYQAFIYSEGKMQDIPTNAAYSESFGYGINNSGHVVGAFTDSSAQKHAFVYDGSQMINLETLIDPAAGWVLYYAVGINDAGQIIAVGNFQNGGHDHLRVCLAI